MTRSLFDLSVLGLVLGLVLDAHECLVLAAILFALAVLLWVVLSTYTLWLKNVNASALLQATEERRRSGGAL